MKKLLFTIAVIFTTSLAFGQKQRDFNLNQSYTIGDNGTIYLNANDAKVTVIGEDRRDVAVKIDYHVTSKGLEWGSREFTVDVESRGGDLHIEELKRSK